MNRQSLAISAALLAVVIVGIGVFMFVGEDDSLPPLPTGPGQATEARSIIREIQQEQGDEAAARPAPARQPVLLEERDAAPGQPAAGGAAAVTPEPAAAAPTGQNAQLDETFDQAMELQAAGQLDDAQMLLFFAARQGHVQSAFSYAELNDPLHHQEGSSLLPEPAPGTAFTYYETALDGGMDEAAERLDALHKWAIDAAAAGDIQAEMLLVRWE